MPRMTALEEHASWTKVPAVLARGDAGLTGRTRRSRGGADLASALGWYCSSEPSRKTGCSISRPAPVSLEARYAIEREIGHGGMAVVYLARDLRHDRDGRAQGAAAPSRRGRSAPTGSCARSGSPPGCIIPICCRSTTRARPAASSTTSCPTSRATRCATG